MTTARRAKTVHALPRPWQLSLTIPYERNNRLLSISQRADKSADGTVTGEGFEKNPRSAPRRRLSRVNDRHGCTAVSDQPTENVGDGEDACIGCIRGARARHTR